MLNLFDNFDQASFDLLRSQRSAQIKIPTVVINDDGFLPTEVESPIKFFGQYNKNRSPLYFDQIPVPKYWRILSTASQGEIYDLDQKRPISSITQPIIRGKLRKYGGWTVTEKLTGLTTITAMAIILRQRFTKMVNRLGVSTMISIKKFF